MTDSKDGVLTSYPLGAVLAYETGGDFEYIPESVSLGNMHYARDCRTASQPPCYGWYKFWITFGLSIEKGVAYLTEWLTDVDGNWEINDAHELKAPGGDVRISYQSFVDAYKGWLSYCQYVAREGADPLHEFSVKATRTVEYRWQFKLLSTVAGIKLLKVRRYKTRAGRYWRWCDPSDVPQHVRDFFFAEQVGNQYILALGDHEDDFVRSIKPGPRAEGSNVRWQRVTKSDRCFAKGIAWISEEVGRPAAYKKELRAAARKLIPGIKDTIANYERVLREVSHEA